MFVYSKNLFNYRMIYKCNTEYFVFQVQKTKSKIKCQMARNMKKKIQTRIMKTQKLPTDYPPDQQ